MINIADNVTFIADIYIGCPQLIQYQSTFLSVQGAMATPKIDQSQGRSSILNNGDGNISSTPQKPLVFVEHNDSESATTVGQTTNLSIIRNGPAIPEQPCSNDQRTTKSRWFIAQAVMLWIAICIPGNICVMLLFHKHQRVDDDIEIKLQDVSHNDAIGSQDNDDHFHISGSGEPPVAPKAKPVRDSYVC